MFLLHCVSNLFHIWCGNIDLRITLFFLFMKSITLKKKLVIKEMETSKIQGNGAIEQ
jgi:hypothetical protein